MFSGIVQDLGKILSIESKAGGSVLLVKTSFDTDIALGDSISVNGVCLTIANFKKNTLIFNVVDETLNKSSLSVLKAGDFVNLEKSLQYNEKISGHLVQGHVEGVGRIIKIENIGTEEVRFSIHLDSKLIKYCIYKGSISIDGISLTIASLKANVIELAIIPHTFKNTNLSFKKVDDIVNIETDMIAKYVENMLIKKEIS
tara:strand:+ start:3154 stop:3753 length:600 start_codon:yes stop_codon:yes gene_type:complete